MNTSGEDDVERWSEALAGRPGAGPPGAPEREASLLRDVILRRAPVEAELIGTVVDPAALDRGWERLAFRLRREGITSPQRSVLARRWVPVALAAALMVGVTTTLVMDRTGDVDFPVTAGEAPLMRSGSVPLVVKASDPVKQAKRLAVALQTLDAAPIVYSHSGKAVVDMNLTPDNWKAVQPVLAKFGVAADRIDPVLRVLRVVFEEGE